MPVTIQNIARTLFEDNLYCQTVAIRVRRKKLQPINTDLFHSGSAHSVASEYFGPGPQELIARMFEKFKRNGTCANAYRTEIGALQLLAHHVHHLLENLKLLHMRTKQRQVTIVLYSKFQCEVERF